MLYYLYSKSFINLYFKVTKFCRFKYNENSSIINLVVLLIFTLEFFRRVKKGFDFFMKIEKLTENKIRIILKQDDFKDKTIDLHTIMAKTAESQGLFLKILDKAKKEVGFDTDGCRILVEAFSTSDDIYVFTVTKYEIDTNNSQDYIPKPKKLKVSRKHITLNNDLAIYEFSSFDDFCDFSKLLGNSKKIIFKNLIGSSSLYCFNNSYYLVLSNINTNNPSIKLFTRLISEFARATLHSLVFEGKLKEYGKCIMKKNAIKTGIKYFSNS